MALYKQRNKHITFAMCGGIPVVNHTIQRFSPLEKETKMAERGSQLFSPFRALGFVTNHVPLTIQAQRTENLVVTAVGSTYHVYNVSIAG